MVQPAPASSILHPDAGPPVPVTAQAEGRPEPEVVAVALTEAALTEQGRAALQRPALEPGASRYSRAARRLVAQTRAAGCQGGTLTLDSLRQLLATCDVSARGRRDRALRAFHAWQEAYNKGVRHEDIMRHTRHRDVRTMRGSVQRAGLVTESPAGALDL